MKLTLNPNNITKQKKSVDIAWYAVYTRSRYEKKLTEALLETGFEAWLPLVKTLRQWSDRKKWVEIPLFNSYIFVRTTIQELNKILLTEGAVYIVSFEGKPSVIPNEQIDVLKRLLDSSEKFEVSLEEFNFGEHIEVVNGPLRGMKGSFVEHKGRKRVLVRMDAINQNLVIDINPSFIKKIPCKVASVF